MRDVYLGHRGIAGLWIHFALHSQTIGVEGHFSGAHSQSGKSDRQEDLKTHLSSVDLSDGKLADHTGGKPAKHSGMIDAEAHSNGAITYMRRSQDTKASTSSLGHSQHQDRPPEAISLAKTRKHPHTSAGAEQLNHGADGYDTPVDHPRAKGTKHSQRIDVEAHSNGAIIYPRRSQDLKTKMKSMSHLHRRKHNNIVRKAARHLVNELNVIQVDPSGRVELMHPSLMDQGMLEEQAPATGASATGAITAPSVGTTALPQTPAVATGSQAAAGTAGVVSGPAAASPAAASATAGPAQVPGAQDAIPATAPPVNDAPVPGAALAPTVAPAGVAVDAPMVPTLAAGTAAPLTVTGGALAPPAQQASSSEGGSSGVYYVLLLLFFLAALVGIGLLAFNFLQARKQLRPNLKRTGSIVKNPSNSAADPPEKMTFKVVSMPSSDSEPFSPIVSSKALPAEAGVNAGRKHPSYSRSNSGSSGFESTKRSYRDRHSAKLKGESSEAPRDRAATESGDSSTAPMAQTLGFGDVKSYRDRYRTQKNDARGSALGADSMSLGQVVSFAPNLASNISEGDPCP